MKNLILIFLVFSFLGCYNVTHIMFETDQENFGYIDDNHSLNPFIEPIYNYKNVFLKSSNEFAYIDINIYLITDEIIKSFSISSCKLNIGDEIIELINDTYYLDNEIITLESGVIKIQNKFNITNGIKMNKIKNIYSNRDEVNVILEMEYYFLMNDNEYIYKNVFNYISFEKNIHNTPKNHWNGDW